MEEKVSRDGDFREKIRRYLVEKVLEEPEFTLTFDEPLLENSVIDSTEIVRLILFIEGEFGIEVDDDEVTLDNFGSINDISAFVDRKSRASEE